MGLPEHSNCWGVDFAVHAIPGSQDDVILIANGRWYLGNRHTLSPYGITHPSQLTQMGPLGPEFMGGFPLHKE